MEEVLDVRLVRTEPVVELEVRNPQHHTRYRVFLPEAPGRGAALCTCIDFARRGLGTCKHVEAAVAGLDRGALGTPTGRPGSHVSADERWKEVDRRLAGLGPEVRDIRAVEHVGSALFEEATAPKGAEPARPDGRPTRTSRARP